jgi:hypothetical protein
MTRKKYSHERKRKEDREKDRNYAPDDIEEEDDVNELEVEQIKVENYEEYNPFKAFKYDYKEIINSINSFRKISYDTEQKKTVVTIENIGIIDKQLNKNDSIYVKLNTNLHLMANRKEERKVASIYKGMSSKSVKTTLKKKIEEFFDKYIGTTVALNTQKKGKYNIIPMKITPSAVSNFYYSLSRMYNVEEVVFRKSFYSEFEEVFTLDDIDLMLSVGVLTSKNNYYFRIPTRIANDNIYNDITTMINENKQDKTKHKEYFNLLKWFEKNNYEYRLPILLFIDSFHDFSKKPSSAKDKALQDNINQILRLNKGETIMNYYRQKMFIDNINYKFPENTVLVILNNITDVNKRKEIFEILNNFTENIMGKTFEKKLLYLYVYYFFIKDIVRGDTVEDQIKNFKEYYTFDITKNPKQLIDVGPSNKYTQDFLMKNESYRVAKKPVHFAVDKDAEFTFIPSSLMDANKANSSDNFLFYSPFKDDTLEIDVYPLKVTYTYNRFNCKLDVKGEIKDNKNFLQALQNCKSIKDPIPYDENLFNYETNNSNTIAKRKLYELNDKLIEIENTLLYRFNLQDRSQLKDNYINFSNGSDGISRGDVLSLILFISQDLYQDNKEPTIQVIDRLLALKRLGDFGQIINCKQLQIPLFTQDSMENLLAIITLTPTIFGNNPRYVYFNGVVIVANNIIGFPKLITTMKVKRQRDEEDITVKRSRNYSPSDELITSELQEYNRLYNKIFENQTFDIDITYWLKNRFNQIFVNNIINRNCLKHLDNYSCNSLDKHLIVDVLNNYLRFLQKIDTLKNNKNIDSFVLYLFAKYDLYDLINNFTGKIQTKEATSILLKTTLQQVLYDLDNVCELNQRTNCKNIENYLNEYNQELKNETTEEEYKNETSYYLNTWNQMKNKNYLIANKIRSRTKNKLIKSSRDNLRKQKR